MFPEEASIGTEDIRTEKRKKVNGACYSRPSPVRGRGFSPLISAPISVGRCSLILQGNLSVELSATRELGET